MEVKSAARGHASWPPRHLGTAHEARAGADEQERDQERGQQHETGALGVRVQEMCGYLEVQSQGGQAAQRRWTPKPPAPDAARWLRERLELLPHGGGQ